jgi:hypothetical protein
MQISEFKKSLAKNGPKNIRFTLPTGSKIPPHAHVTEVARIDKVFIDCGGTVHSETVCRLQTWFADDTDHRLTAEKLLAVLEKAKSMLGGDGFEVDVEHEAPFISQFPIEKIEVDGDSMVVRLGVKHTACLAEDQCISPNLNKPYQFKLSPNTKAKSSCC